MKSKIIVLLALLICQIDAFAVTYKVNQKAQIKPFSIKIEKVEVKDGQTLVHLKIKQQANFSYNISFLDCQLTESDHGKVIKGEVITWNDSKITHSDNKPISDENEEKFTILFKDDHLTKSSSFDLKLGNILNRDKTELVIHDIKLSR